MYRSCLNSVYWPIFYFRFEVQLKTIYTVSERYLFFGCFFAVHQIYCLCCSNLINIISLTYSHRHISQREVSDRFNFNQTSVLGSWMIGKSRACTLHMLSHQYSNPLLRESEECLLPLDSDIWPVENLTIGSGRKSYFTA